MSGEQWRPVVGFPDYLVSDEGRVASLKSGTPRLRASALDSSTGYRKIILWSGGTSRTRPVHRLVAEAFHTPGPGENEVRHINGDKLDNRAANLEWGTHSDNMYDHVRQGKHHSALKTHCPQGHPYDEANTYVLPSRPRARYCRACYRARSAVRTGRAA